MGNHDTATATAARVRAGEVSPIDLTEVALRQAHATERSSAYTSIRDSAAGEARALGDRPDGRLAGVTISVKSNLDVGGDPTSQGVPALADAIAPVDCPLVERLRRAGAIVVARGNLPDFGMRWHTDNDLVGAAVNPWAPDRTPGGSSGGDAAGVAMGVVPLAIGNDYGGSLRIPSAACGVASFKPTTGRIPHAPTVPGPDPNLTLQLMATHGPIARDLDDLRLAFEVMSGPHPDDPTSYVGPTPHRRAGPRRVGVIDLDRCSDEIRDAVVSAIAAFEDDGVEIVDLGAMGTHEGSTAWMRLVGGEVRDQILPNIEPLISSGTRHFIDAIADLCADDSMPSDAEAWAMRYDVGRRWTRAFADVDAILAPIRTVTTPVAEFDRDDDAIEVAWRTLDATLTVNVLGLPSLSWPIHRDGLAPTAVQLIGAAGCDESLLELARPLAEARPIPMTEPTDQTDTTEDRS